MINGVKQPSELGYQLLLVTEGFGVNRAWAPDVYLQLVAGVEAEVATFHLSPYCNAGLEYFSVFLSPLCCRRAPIIANLLPCFIYF